jgi:hypothetical protein
MYYVRQEACQVALRFAARLSGLAFGLTLAVRSAGLTGFQRSGIITGDLFRVRSPSRAGSRASSQVAMPAVLSRSGRDNPQLTTSSGTWRARSRLRRISAAWR